MPTREIENHASNWWLSTRGPPNNNHNHSNITVLGHQKERRKEEEMIAKLARHFPRKKKSLNNTSHSAPLRPSVSVSGRLSVAVALNAIAMPPPCDTVMSLAKAPGGID